jgi:hypothetical protein
MCRVLTSACSDEVWCAGALAILVNVTAVSYSQQHSSSSSIKSNSDRWVMMSIMM